MSGNSEYNRGFEDGLAIGADRIEALQAQVDRLTYDSIHTCHDDCPRLPCVQRREIEGLRADVRHLMNELQVYKDALAQVNGWSSCD